MKQIRFWKMSGAGNDFVVIDNRKHLIRGNLEKVAARFCDRHFGVGADGLLLLEKSKQADFKMVYLNEDGSRASMCGNGARCIAAFAYANRVVGKKFTFETDAGLIGGRIHKPTDVTVTLSNPVDYKPLIYLTANGKQYRASFLNTGVPHLVVPVSRVDDVDMQKDAPPLRFHRALGPKGANVNFVERIDGKTIKVRTFERGVEGETLACGTGVTASAIVFALGQKVSTPTACIARSGKILTVAFQAEPQGASVPATQVTLRGPAEITFKGEIFI